MLEQENFPNLDSEVEVMPEIKYKNNGLKNVWLVVMKTKWCLKAVLTVLYKNMSARNKHTHKKKHQRGDIGITSKY